MPASSIRSTSGREHAADADRGQLGGDHALALAAVALELGALAPRGLHERDVAERLLGHRAERARAAAFLARRSLDEAGEAAGHDEEERRDDQRDQREVPLQVEQRADEEDDLQHRGEGARHAGEDEALDRRDVTAQARQDIAEAAPVERVGREREQVAEDALAHGQQEALAEPRVEQVVGEGDRAAEQQQADARGADPEQRPEVAGDEHFVDDELEEEDLGGLDRDARRDQRQRQRQPAPERAGVGPEPAHDLARRQRGGVRDHELPAAPAAATAAAPAVGVRCWCWCRVRPRVRVRVRVLLELARAAGWIAENTLMLRPPCVDGGDATRGPGSVREREWKDLAKWSAGPRR